MDAVFGSPGGGEGECEAEVCAEVDHFLVAEVAGHWAVRFAVFSSGVMVAVVVAGAVPVGGVPFDGYFPGELLAPFVCDGVSSGGAVAVDEDEGF